MRQLMGREGAEGVHAAFAPRVEAGALSLPRGGNPAQIGARIAPAIYGSFGGETKSSGEVKR